MKRRCRLARLPMELCRNSPLARETRTRHDSFRPQNGEKPMRKAWPHSWHGQFAFATAVFAFVLCESPAVHAQGSKADYERAAELSRKFSGKVLRDRVQANWLPGNTSLWYEVKTGRDAKEFISV